jgi:hypothetical protein
MAVTTRPGLPDPPVRRTLEFALVHPTSGQSSSQTLLTTGWNLKYSAVWHTNFAGYLGWIKALIVLSQGGYASGTITINGKRYTLGEQLLQATTFGYQVVWPAISVQLTSPQDFVPVVRIDDKANIVSQKTHRSILDQQNQKLVKSAKRQLTAAARKGKRPPRR